MVSLEPRGDKPVLAESDNAEVFDGNRMIVGGIQTIVSDEG